ncbi:MAG TPA: MFS transporter [Streptosporangiaceae bacterium]|nr:MFS transporter [Streptosporangiaceae bacterium]
MGDTGTSERARRAGRSVYAASQRAGRVSAAAAGGAGRFVHRMSGASGAGRTGLSNLIELTAAGGIGDAFVAVALAGTLFFSTSVGQARGQVAFALLITIAPYAILAPLIGPLLDRVKRGNRYILIGTLLARGLLCWGMAGADTVTLLPAAFGVLVLQKVYGVTRAAVTPRLLPSEITLVTANARSNLASLIATSVGAALALGVDKIAGGGHGGAAWVLRIGTAIYLAATILGLRLTDRVDATEADDGLTTGGIPPGQPPARDPGLPHTANGAPGNGASTGGHGTGPGGTRIFGPGPTVTAPTGTARATAARAGPVPGSRKRIFGVPRVGPVVGEAMRANAAIRIFYGFILFFLAFILRSERFGHVHDTVALGGLAVAIAAGGMLGTGIGSALRSRAPLAMMFTVLGIATVVTTACAVFFGLWSVLVVALVAAVSQTLVKVALDSILQREIPAETRSSTFAFSETLHQLALVGGGLIGLLLSLTGSGFAGLTVAAIGLALALCWLIVTRRRRIMRARPVSPGPAR